MDKAFAYSGLVMSLIFIIFGVVIPFNPPAILQGWNSWNLWLLGFVLILYGVFRFWRAFKTLKRK